MIDFIAAKNGGIEFFAGVGNPVGFATTPKMVAYIVKTKGMAASVFHSSSMDFADEEGFDTYDGAWKLWETGMELV
jgi:hypothetical protein